jgi:hypothetical protein
MNKSGIDNILNNLSNESLFFIQLNSALLNNENSSIMNFQVVSFWIEGIICITMNSPLCS